MTDSIGRAWQLGTVQLDYVMPERFELAYTGADNADHRPVMIHRALMGSFERFIGILIEHYAGEFPLWLAPVQALVLPLADRHVEYADEVAAALVAAGLRASVDDRTESVGRKIREAELRKVPYMLVVGDREAEQRAVALRRHREGDLGTMRARRRGRAAAGRVVVAPDRVAAMPRRLARAPRAHAGRGVLAAPASAATVSQVTRDSCNGDAGVLEVRAGFPVPVTSLAAAPGEANRVTISREGEEFVVTDARRAGGGAGAVHAGRRLDGPVPVHRGDRRHRRPGDRRRRRRRRGDDHRRSGRGVGDRRRPRRRRDHAAARGTTRSTAGRATTGWPAAAGSTRSPTRGATAASTSTCARAPAARPARRTPCRASAP